MPSAPISQLEEKTDTMFTSNASSIGIIGGADGPTAIFVTTSPNLIPTVIVGTAIVLTAIVVIYLIHKR